MAKAERFVGHCFKHGAWEGDYDECPTCLEQTLKQLEHTSPVQDEIEEEELYICPLCQEKYSKVSVSDREEYQKIQFFLATGREDEWDTDSKVEECCLQCYETKIKPLFQIKK